MHLAETPEQEELRGRLRAYLSEVLTPEINVAAGHGEGLGGAQGSREGSAEALRAFVKRLGSDGWLGLGWPVEYVGQGRPATDQFIMFDEIQRAHAPFPFVTVNTVGPAIMAFGTDEQKRRYLPGILAGETVFAIGYTEPGAGTDLASLTTAAVRDGDEWVVNGSKIFTSGANHADYIWLACRTDQEAAKHKGITILIVPTSSPGFSWTPLPTVGGITTTATYYADVRVPLDSVVGDVDGGWRLITAQLNHERVGLAALSGLTQRLYGDLVEWARETGRIDVPWVQIDLARCRALLDAMRLMTWKLVGAVADGSLGPAEASTVKVFGTERSVEVYRILQGILGPTANVRAGSPGAMLNGEVEQAARAAQINTFGGGVNEIQRELIATAGLGLPRSR